MALHRGDLPQLREHLRRDPRLLDRRFESREIYPPELGCTNDGRSGMHWTPIDGTTLLHLAIDFQEREIFEWLLAQGADVNARATVGADGFGGHTPLFNAAVNGTERDDTMTRALLERGAAKDLRASLHKFIDWCENPSWHEARNVTAAEWARTFPDQGWVNTEALRVLEGS
jgi:ankyrin repeat protein